jgi:hypothetical protein
MTPEEIKRCFEAFPPPKELQWKPWARISDWQIFLKSCHWAIENYKGTLERCPAWRHLKDFYLFIRESPQQDPMRAAAPL